MRARCALAPHSALQRSCCGCCWWWCSLDFVPERSALDVELELDTETRELLKHLELELPGVRESSVRERVLGLASRSVS